MCRKHFDNIQLHEMQVVELKLDVTEFTPMLYLRVLINNQIYSLKFTNVSAINIRDFSLPFQIQGFEILSNKSKGWEKSLAYSVHDYEDEKVSFYCEEVDII